jgi:hypothetical protein
VIRALASNDEIIFGLFRMMSVLGFGGLPGVPLNDPIQLSKEHANLRNMPNFEA